MDPGRLISLLVIFTVSTCFLINGVAMRHINKIIGPTHRSHWGSWGSRDMCPFGTYAAGYNMKIEEDQGPRKDDTALNGIKLKCLSLDGRRSGGRISSKVGYLGQWGEETMCPHNTFLKEFALQVEKDQRFGDDTAANFIKFKCGRFNSSQSRYEIAQFPGYGLWGTMGGWSKSCPAKSAICGIRTKVEGPKGAIGDDTSLNDVTFYCCNY